MEFRGQSCVLIVLLTLQRQMVYHETWGVSPTELTRVRPVLPWPICPIR